MRRLLLDIFHSQQVAHRPTQRLDLSCPRRPLHAVPILLRAVAAVEQHAPGRPDVFRWGGRMN